MTLALVILESTMRLASKLNLDPVLAERRVQAFLEAAQIRLPAEPPPLGVMIETPAAALNAATLAREAAFFAIGTNDLTQYVMAADRLNPQVARLNRTEHPAVMRAIGLVCAAAGRAGIPVAICGEAAARPELIGDFVRLGVSELSMSPASIPRAKKCIVEL